MLVLQSKKTLIYSKVNLGKLICDFIKTRQGDMEEKHEVRGRERKAQIPRKFASLPGEKDILLALALSYIRTDFSERFRPQGGNAENKTQHATRSLMEPVPLKSQNKPNVAFWN